MLLKIALSFQSILILKYLNVRSLCFSLFFLSLASIFMVPSSAISAEKITLNHQENIHIRTLAASCAACHGTDGNSHSITPVLAGLDPTYFSVQMLAFKKGGRDSTVMHHHAEGLTIDEIYELSEYFSQQKRITTPDLKPQVLKASHE
jgi:cytochrome subunit of sulfide dehydrogenase